MEFNHYVGAKLGDLCVEEEGVGRFSGRMGQRRYRNGDDSQYKSKNLAAERKRREKLSQRLLTLRSLVPIITNAINFNALTLPNTIHAPKFKSPNSINSWSPPKDDNFWLISI